MPCTTGTFDGCAVGKQKMFGSCIPCATTGGNEPTTMEEKAKKNGFFKDVTFGSALENLSNSFATVYTAVKQNQNGAIQTVGNDYPNMSQQQNPEEKDKTLVWVAVGLGLLFIGGLLWKKFGK